jgi:hypothetical protein
VLHLELRGWMFFKPLNAAPRLDSNQGPLARHALPLSYRAVLRKRRARTSWLYVFPLLQALSLEMGGVQRAVPSRPRVLIHAAASAIPALPSIFPPAFGIHTKDAY